MKSKLLLFFVVMITAASAQDSSYGNKIADLPKPLAARLAEHNAPNSDGAMGRNKPAYFHVRFQLGIHHLANYGIVRKHAQTVDRFLVAAEYSFRNQLEEGDFSLVIPPELKGHKAPSIADRASGVAFFISSLGSGVYALESSDWFRKSVECKPLRKRLAAVKAKLRTTLTYLFKHREYLEAADRYAPNRLLFDGLAFYTLGRLLHDQNAIKVASSFVKAAIQQTHEDGYFIEGGGFDSSYNGVAAALAFRLLLMGCKEGNLDEVSRKAILWQKSRIAITGEITTAGNTRVNPKGHGESFLGRAKDVDVAHTIEAFMLASRYTADKEYTALAVSVLMYYQKRSQSSR